MNSVYSDEEMNSAFSGKKWKVFIEWINEQCLFREEISNVYSGKTWIVPIQGIHE